MHIVLNGTVRKSLAHELNRVANFGGALLLYLGHEHFYAVVTALAFWYWVQSLAHIILALED